jgi:hypothetical protein
MPAREKWLGRARRMPGVYIRSNRNAMPTDWIDSFHSRRCDLEGPAESGAARVSGKLPWDNEPLDLRDRSVEWFVLLRHPPDDFSSASGHS